MVQPSDEFTETPAEEHDIVSADVDARDRAEKEKGGQRHGSGLLPLPDSDAFDEAVDDDPKTGDVPA